MMYLLYLSLGLIRGMIEFLLANFIFVRQIIFQRLTR